MSMTIRPAVSEDFPHIVRMIRELHIHVGTSEPPKVSTEILRSDGPFGRGNFAILLSRTFTSILGSADPASAGNC
mgnify:CR=1 FL=1